MAEKVYNIKKHTEAYQKKIDYLKYRIDYLKTYDPNHYFVRSDGSIRVEHNERKSPGPELVKRLKWFLEDEIDFLKLIKEPLAIQSLELAKERLAILEEYKEDNISTKAFLEDEEGFTKFIFNQFKLPYLMK
jgi:hypothetical protein